MLVENQVFKIKVNRKNIKWYQSKGYDCDLKDEIEVKVDDLIIGCHIGVKYICDVCNKEKSISYCKYISRKSEKTYCKNCASKYRLSDDYYVAKDGYKICNECKRKLLSNTDYFFSKHDTKDGFRSKCKECSGLSFTDKLIHIPRKGYKFCIKCDRELLIDIKYFPPDKMCKDGLRNVCRECGKDKHFMKDGYIPKEHWTKEKEQILIDNYAKYTNTELIKLFFPNEINKSLHDKAWLLSVTGKDLEVFKRINQERSKKMSGENSVLFGVPKSEETKRKISLSKIGKYVGKNNYLFGKKWDRNDKRRKLISDRKKGEWAGDKNPRFITPLIGKENPNWRGGITALYFELRSEIKEWQQQSMEYCNYKCVLSGKDFDNIHHLYPFRKIVNEIFEILNLDQRQKVLDYSEIEFNNIKDKLCELHKKYGLGVCISKSLHKLFHDTYGYINNNKEQFIEFSNKYKNYEFDDLLENKYKYCNALLREII